MKAMSKPWDDSPDADLARRLGLEPPQDPRPEKFHELPWFIGLFAGPHDAITADGERVTVTIEPEGTGPIRPAS